MYLEGLLSDQNGIHTIPVLMQKLACLVRASSDGMSFGYLNRPLQKKV